MRIFAYALREFDEKELFITECEKAGVDYGYTSEYPSLENAHLAEGYDGLSIITNPIDPGLAQRFYDLGIRHISSRTVGIDHIDLDYCKKIGRELRTCTVGIIGTGRIGKTVIRDLTGFGCRILCYDVNPQPDEVKPAACVSLDELPDRGDILIRREN